MRSACRLEIPHRGRRPPYLPDHGRRDRGRPAAVRDVVDTADEYWFAFLDHFGIKPWEIPKLKGHQVMTLVAVVDQRTQEAEKHAQEMEARRDG